MIHFFSVIHICFALALEIRVNENAWNVQFTTVCWLQTYKFNQKSLSIRKNKELYWICETL